MTISGFGTQPFGISAMGLGVAADPGAVPVGNTSASRYVDPQTGEYSLDSVTGHLRQITSTMQRVLTALRVTRGQATAAPGFGFTWPRKMGTTFAAEVEAEIRRCLRSLTDSQRAIRIDSITVTRGTHRAAADISYTVIETGKSERIEFTQ